MGLAALSSEGSERLARCPPAFDYLPSTSALTYQELNRIKLH